MKRIIALLAVWAVFIGCEPVERDFVNPDVTIFVQNSQGENLLDSEVDGNLLGSDIYAEYNDDIYRITMTRDSGPARWQGLRIEPYNVYANDYTPVLRFGEFKTSSIDEIRGETFIIHWGDGTSDEVKFDLYVKGRKNVVQRIWLNGKLASDNSLVVRIVKE